MKKVLISLIAISFAGSLYAQKIWNGSTDTAWNTAGNWGPTTGKPGFGGTAIFSGAATANQPDIFGNNQTGIAFDFQTAGWTVSDSVGGGVMRVDQFLFINSAGAGSNQIDATIGASGGGAVGIEVGSGNTLRISKEFTVRNLDYGTSSGTLLFDGTVAQGQNGTPTTVSTGLTILSNNDAGYYMSSWTLSAGAKMGGTGKFVGGAYGNTTFGSSSILAPGGDGTNGAEISTLTWQSGSDTVRHELIMDTGSSLDIQLGGTLAEHDKLELDLTAAGNGNLTINSGATLNLFGTGALQDGAYTIVENIDSAAISGTFDTVNYNGSAVDPGNFTVDYTADTIVVNVTGVIPEPSTWILMLTAFFGIMLCRRKKA